MAIPDALMISSEPRGHAKVLNSPDAESVGGESVGLKFAAIRCFFGGELKVASRVRVGLSISYSWGLVD